MDSLQQGHQAMVFVHSRKDTGKTGRTLIEKGQKSGGTAQLDPSEHPQWGLVNKEIKKSRNK